MVKGSYKRAKIGLRLLVVALSSLFLFSCGSQGNSGNAGVGATTRSDRSSVPSSAPLSAPLGVTVTAGNGEVTLSWTAVPGAASYNVYYLTYPGVTTINAKQRTSAISGDPITGLMNTVTYYFRVTSMNAAGEESAASSEVSAKPMPPLPGIPRDVQLDPIATNGIASTTVKWQKVPYATSYNVYYGTTPGLTTSSPTKISNITLTEQAVRNLTSAPGHYYFIVTAVNESGESAPSVELSAVASSAYKAIAAGYGHSVAIRVIDDLQLDQGSVWSWGDNALGELGTGNNIGSLSPLWAATISEVTNIAAAYHNTIALTRENAIFNWGLNATGQLGRPNSINPFSKLPLPAKAYFNNVAVAAGGRHMISLQNDGTVWTWGYNSLGQLGRDSADCLDFYNPNVGYTCDTFPTQVPGITGVAKAIAGGEEHTLVALSDGTLLAWGRNDTGQLGNTSYCPPSLMAATPFDVGFLTNTSSSCGIYPVPIVIPAWAIAVAGGLRHSVALMSDGNVWTWGGDKYGQLGEQDALNLLPGEQLATTQTCTITSAFTMQCTTTPRHVKGLDHIIAIAAGKYFTLALKSDGTVWQWGYEFQRGELDDATIYNASNYNRTPVKVPGLSGGKITAIAAGAYHALALKDNGTVWAWGYNGKGQLGDGTTTDRSTPVQVQGLPGPVVIIPGL